MQLLRNLLGMLCLMDNANSKDQERQLAVCIMPWAGLRQEVKMGPVRFWPWDEKRVPDPNIRQLLKRYFKCFVDHHGDPVKTITICSYGEQDFELLEQCEYNELRAAIDVLIFSIIAPQTRLAVCGNTSSAGPPTTDRYQVIGQQLRPGDPNIYIKAGSSLSVDEMDDVHISQPWCLGGSFRIGPDEELVRAFDRIFNQSFPSIIRERIFRSLEWFRFAHTEAEQISETSKLVMMATVFEIFLQVPNIPQKKKFLAEKIEEIISDRDFLTETRPIGNRSFTYSKVAWWAWDFYTLRNRIVHGDQIAQSELRYINWITFNIVADLVFWELVKRDLYTQGCLGERVRKWTGKFQAVSKDDPTKIEDVFIRWMLGFNDVHEALGWKPRNE